jgi:hypothetical protein
LIVSAGLGLGLRPFSYSISWRSEQVLDDGVHEAPGVVSEVVPTV